MSHYVFSVNELGLGISWAGSQQSSIQQILRLGYLQESNRTQWYYLERKGKRCILLGCWGLDRPQHPGAYSPISAGMICSEYSSGFSVKIILLPMP